jgi:hypothetical protein
MLRGKSPLRLNGHGISEVPDRVRAGIKFPVLWSAGPICSDCGLASPSFVTGAPNIFNAQQEQDLGDALAEYEESDYKIAPPLAVDQLTRIGERLVAALPLSGLRYRFQVYDSGEINGFRLAEDGFTSAGS